MQDGYIHSIIMAIRNKNTLLLSMSIVIEMSMGLILSELKYACFSTNEYSQKKILPYYMCVHVHKNKK